MYPHIGTIEPSGMVAVVGPAVKLTCCWARRAVAPRRRIVTAHTAVFRVAFR
jgi:hypothetical protein